MTNTCTVTEPRKIEPAWTPQVMGALADVRVTDIIAGPCAAHSFFITDKGQLYGIGTGLSYFLANTLILLHRQVLSFRWYYFNV